MKHVVVQEPVDYIEFDDGTRIQYDKLCHEIEEMKCADYTEFRLKDPQDKALFDFIYERLCMDCTSEIGYTDQSCFNTTPRIYWNDHNQFINNLLNEIVNIRYGDKEKV